MKKTVHIRLLTAVVLVIVMGFGSIPVQAVSDNSGVAVSISMKLNARQATINQELYAMDQPPLVIGGRAFVPLRFVSEALGATVEWEPQDQRILVQDKGKQVVLFLHEKMAHVDGNAVPLDEAPFIVNGRTLVPVRFISEVLGFSVAWCATEKAITITGKVACESTLASLLADAMENQLPEEDMTEERTFNGEESAGEAIPEEAHLAIEREVIQRVNEYREEHGLQPLRLNNQLMNTARVKSQDMVDERYFAHTSPVYGELKDLLQSHGIRYRTAAENIASGHLTSRVVVDAWMDSPGHQANILNPHFNQIGVGAVQGGMYGGITWTQLFTD